MSGVAPPAPAIAVEGLTKRYRSTRGVDDVTLTIAPGERFGLLGPNGSGKTTLIRLILGLLHPDAGTVEVAGHDMATRRGDGLAHIGYLPGELAVVGGLTGGQTLRMLGRLHPRPPVLRAELCDVLGLSDADLARPVRQYSRGMKQKVGLVAALQHDPPIALLDEPTGGLDPLVQMRLMEALRAASGRGTTVIFSSHIIAEVEDLCDRVGMMGAGRLLAVESVSGLSLGTARTVAVRFAQPTDPSVYVPGDAEGLTVDDDGRRHAFTIHGRPGDMLARLAPLDPVDVEITPMSLEDAVRRLYRPEGAA